MEQVFHVNRDRLLAFLRLRGAGDAAEDLLQEIWIRVNGFEAPLPPAPHAYLFRMAQNLLRDHFRSEVSRAKREREWSAVYFETATMGMSAAPERSALARAELARLAQHIDALGEPASTIFRRFRVDGMSQSQIAMETGLSRSSIEKYLQRAYRAIADWRDG